MARILIADDEPLMRRLEADFLKRDGHEVVEAEDGAGCKHFSEIRQH